jgi:hypothetical protein
MSALTNSNRFWMFLSGNAELALFRSTNATTIPAAKLTMPAAARPSTAAPSTANVSAVFAISPTSNGAASTISVSAVDAVAIPMLD